MGPGGGMPSPGPEECIMNGKSEDNNVLISDLSALRAKLALHLFRARNAGEVGSSITQLSKAVGVAKSTMSRTVSRCVELGLVMRVNGKYVALTEKGLPVGEELERRCREVRLWFGNMFGADSVDEDAVVRGAISLPDSTAQIMERNTRLQSLHLRVGDRAILPGEEFCTALGDGKFPVSVMFYRANAEGNRKLPSMANDGIESDGELVIENNRGLLRLKSRPVEHIPLSGNGLVKGRLSTLKYYDGADYKTAKRKGDVYYFPANAMSFVCVSGRVTQGNVVLKMSCSAGPEYMPESESVMEVFFRS
jgi:DNA-binding MarR family transcriptional regulator